MSVAGEDVAAGVEGDVGVVQLTVSDAARVSVSGFVAEEVFAPKEMVAASVVSVLVEVNLCGANVCCVNGDEVGGNLLTLEQISPIPVVEANILGRVADVEGGVLDVLPHLVCVVSHGVSPLCGFCWLFLCL